MQTAVDEKMQAFNLMKNMWNNIIYANLDLNKVYQVKIDVIN